jgi:hypothetical protein
MQAPRTGATRTGRIDISSRSPLTAALGALASTSGVATSTKAAAPAPISAAASTTAARLEVRTKGLMTSPLYLPIGRLTAEEVQRFPWNQTSRQRLLSRQNRGQRAGNTAARLARRLRVGRSRRFPGGIGIRLGLWSAARRCGPRKLIQIRAIHAPQSVVVIPGAPRSGEPGIQEHRSVRTGLVGVPGFRTRGLRPRSGMTDSYFTAPAGAEPCS